MSQVQLPKIHYTSPFFSAITTLIWQLQILWEKQQNTWRIRFLPCHLLVRATYLRFIRGKLTEGVDPLYVSSLDTANSVPVKVNLKRKKEKNKSIEKNIHPAILYKALLNIIGGKGAKSNINHYRYHILEVMFVVLSKSSYMCLWHFHLKCFNFSDFP